MIDYKNRIKALQHEIDDYKKMEREGVDINIKCPFCGRFLDLDECGSWTCLNRGSDPIEHVFAGPESDKEGKGVKRLILKMKQNVKKEIKK